jgi:hypothetical protein
LAVVKVQAFEGFLHLQIGAGLLCRDHGRT